MRKKITTILSILAVMTITAPAFSDECMRHNGRLACVGDNMAEVVAVCGAPDFRVVVSTETNAQKDVVEVGDAVEFADISYSTHCIERWVYVMGPGRFMRILTFEKDRLTAIETGDKP